MPETKVAQLCHSHCFAYVAGASFRKLFDWCRRVGRVSFGEVEGSAFRGGSGPASPHGHISVEAFRNGARCLRFRLLVSWGKGDTSGGTSSAVAGGITPEEGELGSLMESLLLTCLPEIPFEGPEVPFVKSRSAGHPHTPPGTWCSGFRHVAGAE